VCRHQAILQHFDEQIAPCDSSCDVCTGISGEETARNAVAKTKGLKGAASGSSGGSGRARALPDISDIDADLFDRLRALRKKLADAQGVPAYIVFGDATLAAIAAARPTNEEELLDVSGVGPAKLEKYGQAFLDLLNE
jgi:ATP-dependent DNA helicase RecQ